MLDQAAARDMYKEAREAFNDACQRGRFDDLDERETMMRILDCLYEITRKDPTFKVSGAAGTGAYYEP